ncbi:MAG: RdgB/HAM1 family non-canonical purine NTP pyrophosphatase [Clostridiales bacterium]|jgi:XTP/dITP diphosphohydrolase|nr:RdgB/HAM1 family non-canonical purine NTP pyrophosphatase [Clostridiales bacterium]
MAEIIELVVASNNKNKLREFKEVLGNKFKLTSLDENNIHIEIEESGNTFYENALIKAKTVAELCNKPAIADDSGLVVDSLNGLPGINSARYAGENASDEMNRRYLLKNMHGIKDRSAHFLACIVVYYPSGDIITSEGKVMGEILCEERGSNGFGYDSIFYSYELGKAFAEAESAEKNKVSHRGRALQSLIEQLKV